jgi:sec-independent protein translocase protein TatA
MNVFGIGLPEMAVIAAIALLVFGPKRLPELGRSLGRTLKGFQSASREFEQEFRQAIDTETVQVNSVDRDAPALRELPTGELPTAELPDGPPASEDASEQVTDPASEGSTDPLPLPTTPLPTKPSA